MHRYFHVGLAVLGLFSTSLLAAPGGIDGTFGTGGKAITSIVSGGRVTTAIGSASQAYSVAVQSDGGIVVAGAAFNGSNYDMALARYTSSGTLDTSFGSGGVATTSFGGQDDGANSVVVQSDGKIIAAGYSYNQSTSVQSVTLARFTSAGALDVSFGSGGKVVFDFGGYTAEAFRLLLQSDGKIIVAGGGDGYLAFARLTSAGALDASFGSGGKATTDLEFYSANPGNNVNSVCLQADGKIVAVISTVLARYTSTGALDTSFGSGGEVVTGAGGDSDDYSVAVQSNGKILVAGGSGLERYTVGGVLDTTFGTSGRVSRGGFGVALESDGKILVGDGKFGLLRYTAAGLVDESFGNRGFAATSFSTHDFGPCFVVHGDGRIVLAGIANRDLVHGSLGQFAVVRYTPGGGLDSSFGPSTTLPAEGLSVALQVDGGILVAGTAMEGNISNPQNNSIALTRYTASGVLDGAFGNNGQVITPGGNGTAVAVQSDGKIIVAGYSRDGYQNTEDFLVARYTSSGELDATFGNGGRVRTDFGGYNDEAYGVALQQDGKILAAGFVQDGSRSYFGLARYTSAGQLDTTFGTGGKVTTAVGATNDGGYSVVVQSDGKILVAGYSDNGSDFDFALARYTSAGVLDMTFGNGGKVVSDFGFNESGQSLTVQSDGKILLAGYTDPSSNKSKFALLRYTSAGALDVSFGTGGQVTTELGLSDTGNSVALQQNGKIVVGGYSSVGGTNNYSLARYTTTGQLDTTFGSGGKVTTQVGLAGDVGTSVAIQSDGRILLAGYSAKGAGNAFALVRYEGDASANANLSALMLSAGVLSPVFATETTSYTASVGNGTNSVTVTPVAADANATIEVKVNNGGFAAVGSGSTSGALALNVGANTVNVQVTAPDGTTIKAYTVTVTRASAGGGGGDDGGGQGGGGGPHDKVKPVVTISTPAKSEIANPFTLHGTVTETVELASVSVSVNGGQAVPATFSPSSGAAIQWSLPGLTLENGVNSFVVTAVDAAGNPPGKATKAFNYVNPGLAAAVGSYNALLVPTGMSDNDTAGLVSVKITATGAFTGKAMLGGVSKPFSGILRNDGTARFKAKTGFMDALALVNGTTSLGSLSFTIDSAMGLNGILSSESGALAQFVGKVSPYTTKNPVPADLLNQPATGTPSKGYYTVVFASKAQSPPVNTSTYPQGDGYAGLTLTKTGSIKLAGVLADGTKYTASGALRADGTVALFTSLYAKKGGLEGELTLADLADTDVSGTGLLWLRPDQQGTRKPPIVYAAGWPAGIRVDVMGTKYSKPASLDFGQGAADPALGNATLKFHGGTLAADATERVSIDPGPVHAGQVKTIRPVIGGIPTSSPVDYKFTLNATTGVFTGVFLYAGAGFADSSKAKFGGILLNKGANKAGCGYFLSPPRPGDVVPASYSGSVLLDPGSQ